MSNYAYVIIDKKTGVPVCGGPKKYHVGRAWQNIEVYDKIESGEFAVYRTDEEGNTTDISAEV